MQRVIKTVYTNLTDLKLAIDGTIVMSNYLRDSLDSMYDGKIPDRWTKVSEIEKFKTNLKSIPFTFVEFYKCTQGYGKHFSNNYYV